MNRIFILSTIFAALTTTLIPETLGNFLDGNSGGYRYVSNAEAVELTSMQTVSKRSCFARTWDGFNGEITRDCL